MILRAPMTLLFLALPCLMTAMLYAQDELPAPVVKRDVVVNLSVDKPEGKPTLKLKVKGGAVIAETPNKERLEYEVAISGAGGETVAYFPVPAGSPIHAAYLANKDTAPQKVLETLRDNLGDPLVRIIAVRTSRTVEQYRYRKTRESLRYVSVAGPWEAFYEVQLADSADATPLRIPVPKSDAPVHEEVRKLPVGLHMGAEVTLHHLSGPRS